MHAAYDGGPDPNFGFAATPHTVPKMRILPLLALAVAAAFAACDADEEQPREGPAPAPSRDQPAAPAVPDGGVREGHGAEDEAPPPRERGSIVVPETDRTPPRPVVRFALARATLDRGAPRVLVSLAEPIEVTVVGRDRDGGMGRARVAISARLTCRDTAGKVTTQPFVRYVPPPQVVRIRIAPGTRTRAELRQTVTQRFGTAECKGATLERFSGQAWADTTNASGLDATSKHIHFASR
jgi:hypothetical protein